MSLFDLEHAAELFETMYGQPHSRLFFAPGRVNLIGDHIDYNGGRVLPAALSLGIYALVRPRDDERLVLNSLSMPGYATVALNTIEEQSPNSSWTSYVIGVALYLTRRKIKLQGADILFASTLPAASGLSSSAALEVLTGFVLQYLAGQERIDLVDLARMCQKVENEFIGVNCGIMDQFSVALGKKDHAILLDTNSLEFEYVPVKLREHQFIIIHSGKKRELAESKYNERRSECDSAFSVLQLRQGIDNLCQADVREAEILLRNPTLHRRVRHVVSENERVVQSVIALKKNDLETFGRLMNESHLSLKEDYEVTGKELDALQSACVAMKECLGARMTGAGFGGCVVALIDKSMQDSFIEGVRHSYQNATGLKPVFMIVDIDDGVRLI